MKILTVADGKVTDGAEIGSLILKGAGTTIPAIIIGEEGRGRLRGVIPVVNPPTVSCPEAGKKVWTNSDSCSKCGMPLGEQDGHYRQHGEEGEVTGRLHFAVIGETRSGKLKFFARQHGETDDHVIVVLRTPIGFRGGNGHWGDRIGWSCPKCETKVKGDPTPETCPVCAEKEREPAPFSSGYNQPRNWVEKFPGEVIAEGTIAQGAAGRAGSGSQKIAILPKGAVFQTTYSGRRYGSPTAHFYVWDGEALLAATSEERELSDVF